MNLRGCELYFDCFAGIAGDMALGALLDLGVPEEFVRAELAKLPVGGWRLERKRVKRGALVGTKIHVHVGEGEHVHGAHQHHDHSHDPSSHAAHHHHDDQHPSDHGGGHRHAHYHEIRHMLCDALAGEVLARALAMFDRIAEVEARLHGVPVDEVAFHEVGAVDSIIDIVGTAAALAWLRPSRITCRRVPLGGGTVETAHGTLPVPAPATLELLAAAEVEAEGDSELTTPTGAAIVAASVGAFGPLPPMKVEAVGWGAGDRELSDRPNLLRVVAGWPVEAAKAETPAVPGDDEVVVIEANVDDMNPEWIEPLMDALFAAGALDAWSTPIVMKKGRPALTVSALSDGAHQHAVTMALLRHSTSIGARYRTMRRTTLPRRLVEVSTQYGPVPVKVADGEGGLPANVAPEYEACRWLAREKGVPIKDVYQAALAAFYSRR
jgi:pyridinium-3,5-bisthiocarboxylic acid mononucleotide nickel chelatase